MNIKIINKSLYIKIVMFYIIVQVLSESTLIYNLIFDSILYGMRWLCLGGIMIYDLYKFRTSKKKLCVLLILNAFFLINAFLFSGGNFLIAILFFAIGFEQSNVSIKEVMYSMMVCIVVSELVVVIMSLLGVLDNELYSRSVSIYSGSFFSGEHNRYTLGFKHYNQIPFAFFDVILLFICYKENGIKLWHCFLLLIFNTIIYQISNVRTIFVLNILLIIIVFMVTLYLKNHHIKQKRTVWWGLPFFLSLVSFYTAYSFDVKNWSFVVLNEILSNRLLFAREAVLKYGSSLFSLFGNGIDAGTSSSNFEIVVDNGYIVQVLQRGVIISSIFLLIWALLISGFRKRNMIYYYICVIMIVFANAINDEFSSYRLLPFYCLAYQVFVSKGVKKAYEDTNNNCRL